MPQKAATLSNNQPCQIASLWNPPEPGGSRAGHQRPCQPADRIAKKLSLGETTVYRILAKERAKKQSKSQN